MTARGDGERRPDDASTVPSVLLASAELSPIATVGGLGAATSGLAIALRSLGAEVTVVIPDYGGLADVEEIRRGQLEMPDWAGRTGFRVVRHRDVGEVVLVQQRRLVRTHPYTDPLGEGWADNTDRFIGFSRAVVALADLAQPDVVHLNDWHTSAAATWLSPHQASVLTIHNLAFQGWCDPLWLARLGGRRRGLIRNSAVNLLAGAIAESGRVVAVSRTYAAETRTPQGGLGLDDLLTARGDSYTEVRNGIDLDVWNPSRDPALATHFDRDDLAGKESARRDLLAHVGWQASSGPIIGFVGRFVEQKGIDLLLSIAPFLHTLPARLIVMGRGNDALEQIATEVAALHPDRVHYERTTDAAFAHRLVAGADLVAVPSRFEPCGLVQMEAMTYGTLPVVNPVGGLNDTVIDIAEDPERGNGFVGRRADGMGLLDALHRAVRTWQHEPTRRAMQSRGMSADWSWTGPANSYLSIYNSMLEVTSVATEQTATTAAWSAPATPEQRGSAASAQAEA